MLSYPPHIQKQIARAFVKRIELFPTKRAYGYVKSIHFSIPIVSKEEIDNKYTIWDEYPLILDSEGNYNGYEPETDFEWEWENSDTVVATADTEYASEMRVEDIAELDKINEEIEKAAIEKISLSIKHIVETVCLMSRKEK